MLGPSLLVLALLDLRGWTQGRPAECGALAGEHGANPWERAKTPALRPYCDALASGAAKLVPGSRMVVQALSLAEAADKLVPGTAAPKVLEGRALVELGRFGEAAHALREAAARDPHALDDPAALLAWARSLAVLHDPAARAAYRRLLPSASALPLAERGVAYLGAGVLALSDGASSIDEAIAILREGRRQSLDLIRSAETAALALALDRAGQTAEAIGVLGDGGTDAVIALGEPRVTAALGEPGAREAVAMKALALELTGKEDLARAAWRAYLADGSGPWDAHARSHLSLAPRSSRVK